MSTLQIKTGGLALAAAGALLLAGSAAHAQSPFQPIQVDFAPIVETVTPGSTVTFAGTITNTTGSSIFITEDIIDPFASGLTTDDTPFADTFAAGAPVELASFQTYFYTDLFTVSADSGVAPGLYKGEFTVFGGSAPLADDVSGTSDFYVRVPTPAVPEASSVVSFGLLLLGGMTVLACKNRKRVPSV